MSYAPRDVREERSVGLVGWRSGHSRDIDYHENVVGPLIVCYGIVLVNNLEHVVEDTNPGHTP